MRTTRPARRTRGLVVGAVSVALHGALGWMLLKAVPAPATLTEPRSVVVELFTPDPPRTLEHPAPSRAPAPSPVRVASRRDLPPPLTTPPPPRPAATPSGAIVAPPGFTARGTLTGGGEALRQAARQSGCTEADVVKLTKAEREACAETLGARNKNGPALYAAIDPDKKAAFDGDCKKDDDWCLYRAGKGPYPGLFAIGKKKKIKGWD